MKVKLKRMRMVAQWTWNGADEVCGICQNALDGCSPDSEFPGDDCPVIWGSCKHTFHLPCIMEWLKSQNAQNTAESCPMCRRPWEFGATSAPSHTTSSQSTSTTILNNSTTPFTSSNNEIHSPEQ